jgi:hypothetical protein
MKGPKTFGEWVRVYEGRDSDTDYVVDPDERIRWHPMHGFFTYWYDARNKQLVIPKMCGNGKFWRKVIHDMVLAAGPGVCRGVYCCFKRNPIAYSRVLGGRVTGVERSYDFKRKKGSTLWYIFITPKDTKEGRYKS